MFPPILTNRTLNSTNLPTVDESRCSLSPKDATTSNIDTEPMADLNDAEQMLSVQATKKQNKFFFTCPDIQREQSPERSDYSDYVDDDWSSIEDGENPRASREAQEAEIEDKYRSALNFLEEGNAERAVSIFSTLLLHPIMTKYHIPDWSAYDWKRAIADTPQKIVPNMAKLFFNINLAMIGLVEDPFQFYVQALSIRPDFKDLWFNCGQFAISRRDWRSAEFCMTQCEDEFRALEALSLIRYLSNDYFKCTAVLQRVFESCPEHQTGHVIRQLISESSPFWTECHSKLFSRDISEFCVEKLQKDKILRNFETFQRECIRPGDKCSSLFFQRVTSSMPSWAPLTIKIKTEIKLVELGKLLCNIYDRIGESSSFAEQRVFFEFESQNHYVQRKIINFGDEVGTEEKRLSAEDSQPVSESDEQMQELGSVEGHRQPSGSDELQAMDGDEFVETFLEQIALTEDSDGRAEGEAGNRAQIVDNEPETQDEMSLRRSMRLIDDLNYFGNSLQPRPDDALNRQLNVLTLMGFEDSDLKEQQIALSNHKHTVHFKSDSIVPQKLPSVNKLISLLIEQSTKETTKYPNTLRTFLGWVAFEQDPFMVLTLEEADAFREVYDRWSGLCLGICPNTTADLAVHQLAAELGSHRALSILQAFYGRRFLKKQKTFSNLLADGEKEIVGKSHLADSFRGTTMQFAQKSLNADSDVFRWVFDRIHSEQQQLRRGESDRPTVIERNEDVSANSDESQQSMDCPNSSTVRRQLEVRYKWLIANLLPEELCLPNSEAFHFIHAFSELNSALSLMEPHWTLWSHAEFDIGCLTVRNLKEVLRKRVRQFQLQQIDYLIEAKRYEELKNVLLHQYDWTSDSDDAHIKQKFLLIQCIRETDNSLTDIGLWISKILNKICRDDISDVLAKRSLRRCIHLLDELFPADLFERSPVTESFFAAVGYYLGKLVQPALYEKSAQCSDLWRWCSKIAKFREGQLNVSKLKAFYASDSALLNRRHPTKTTMLLAKGHEVLGKMKKCSRKEGMFLRLLIDEFLNTIRDPSVRLVLALPEYSDIRENVVSEIVQCLRCCSSDKFAQSRVRSNRVADHGSKLQWPVDRDFATKVLELILPPKLPEICSDIRVPSDFADLLIKAFDHLLEVDETQLRCLDEMLQNPFRLELEEKFDSDGLCCGYEERLQMSEEGKLRLENLTKIGNAEGETNTFSEFSAKCVYLLAYFHYRTGSGSGEEWLRKCLAIGGRHLPPNILASAWYALGRSLTYSYAIKNDEELLDRVEAYVFPFRMALFLHWEFAESHLDVGTIIYQLRTRFARFKVQRDVSKELRCKTQQKVEGMLQKCKVHFRLALRFNDSPKDVAWLSNYFLAKIAEKLGDPPETVLDLYYHCALALEEEGIQYLTKINRIKQTYFEPLEIHYKVHAYALRYLGVLNSPSFPPRTSFQCAKDLSTIHVYLKLFQHHGVQRRSMEDAHWSETAFYEQPNLPKTWDRLLQPKSFKPNDVLRENVSEDVEGEVADLIGSLVCASDLYFDIVRMCQTAFNAILQRFPHYKAFYRVARAFFDERNFARCADILFDRLFLTGRKQKCNNFLENIVEIKRSDFERNGSFPYHLCKIVKLAVVACFKYDNIGRLKDLVVALTSYKPSSASREILGEPLVRELLGMASRGFKSLVEKQQGQYGHDMQQLGKLIEQIEGVIGKLKKDGRCQKERSALETTLIACIQRRDKMVPRTDRKCAIGSTVGGPPPKMRRKDEALTENPSTSGSHIFPTKQSTKGVITQNGEKIFCRRVLETPLSQVQKTMSSSHLQSNSQALRSFVSLALARQAVQTNGPPSLPSAASSSPAHVDPFPGLPRSALSSMLATLTSQLNQQPIPNQQRQHPPIMTLTSTTSSSSSRQTQGQQQNSASLNYRNNEQQSDLLFSHLLNLQRIEQLRQISERFGLNWNGGGSQSQRK
ncbi:hypothetical protein GPALN_011227 [Globodera pallida]|nr:hypothetical protein GPALN_011227 [Globodera pallida]